MTRLIAWLLGRHEPGCVCAIPAKAARRRHSWYREEGEEAKCIVRRSK